MSTTFSVIVTCYNYKTFVEEAVDSALAQTRAPVQVIVVDDGSTDGSTELLKTRYGSDPRVTLVCGKNGGQLAAFQRGVAVAEADVLCFLDADDRWDPDYLDKVGALFDARRDIDFVFSDVVLFGKESERIGFADRELDLGITAVSTFLTAHWYGAPTSALSLRRTLALRTLDLPDEFRITWRVSADNCLVYGAGVLGGHKYFLPTGSVGYRIHGNNSWWGKRSARNDYLNLFHSRCLVHHYAQRIGLDPACAELLRHEFKTKPLPSWQETRRYARLSMRRAGSWLRNLDRAFSILRKGWKVRDQAAQEIRHQAR